MDTATGSIRLLDAGKDAMLSYVFPLLRALLSATGRLARNSRCQVALAGFALGIAEWSAAHPFVATFGFNREAVGGLLLAAAGSFCAGAAARRRRPQLSAFGVVGLVAAAWLVMLTGIVTLTARLVAGLPPDAIANDGIRLAAAFAAGLTVIGVPSFCAGIFADSRRVSGQGSILVVAAGGGVLANALVLGPTVGLQAPLLLVCVATALVWFVRLARGRMEAVQTATAAQESVCVLTMIRVALVGVGCGVSGRVLGQVMLESSYLVAAGVSLFLMGSALGSVFARRGGLRRGDSSAPGRLGACIAACALLLLLASFPWLVERHLDANAWVSSVFWLAAIRIGTIAAMALPLGTACGLMAGRGAGTSPLALVGGLLAAGWLIPAAGVVPLSAAIGVLLLGTALLPATTVLPRSREGWAAAAACGLLVIVCGSNIRRYDPARAAQLLFSTETFIARQRGVPAELLPHLDDTRLLTFHETAAGTLTVWRQRGEAAVLRLNGVPVAATSRRSEISPAPTADVMRVALPLLLHPDAETVLLLGDPASVASRTAARFPVREVVRYDAIPPRAIVADLGVEDERISSYALDPRIGLAAERRRFDVIVSDPGMPATLSAVSCLTREFYSCAAAHLGDGGLFCQRLRYADLGAEPLRVIAASMRDAFGELMIIEIGSGEYALLGALPGESIARPGLVERLKRPHARRTLASLGWDWCVPLNLVSLEDEPLEALAANAERSNTDANGWLASTLPFETMRWGPKWRELQQATAGKSSRLLVRGVSADAQREVLDRIAEVTGQHRLMTAFPDQPWGYRKELRAKLTEKPREVIQPVAGEVRRKRHPEDRRRLDYLEALGAAIRETTPENLAEVERFAAPYDPLVTYFLHHEIAPLYAELEAAGSAGELWHRLHAAYFADPNDRSVRDVTAAIDAISKHPDAIPDDADRFDHFNALIEVLLTRWEARGMAEPRSPEVVMIDIDMSLDAVEAALGTMDRLAPVAGVGSDEWLLRKAAIERTLTRPLRKYRTTLLPHLRAAHRSR